MGSRAPRRVVSSIAAVTGFSHKSLPIKYLGCPLYAARQLKSHYVGMIDAINARVRGWCMKLLSMGARIVLIKSVLSSLPIYILSVSCPPRGVLHQIEKIFSNFLWGSSEYGSRRHWASREALCRPEEEGGFSFRVLN